VATKNITLTKDQQDALDVIFDWVHNLDDRTLTLGGYAGTGKTTLVREIIDSGTCYARIVAPTGKACQVLARKGLDAITIHKLLYLPPEEDPRTKELIWTSNGISRSGFLIADEASMIAGDQYRDLMSTSARILFVGDHGQLQPVGDDPGIMRKPDICLETICRQVADSPILKFATLMRTGDHGPRFPPIDTPGLLVKRPPDLLSSLDPEYLLQFDQILVALNGTRIAINERIRESLGRGPAPVPGDKVICLRNDYKLGLMNGQILTVTGSSARRGDRYWLDLVDNDTKERFHSVPAHADQFNEKQLLSSKKNIGLFDFGYAITVHKAQGSEWNYILVIEERAGDAWDPRRWRYTAVTRAKEMLVFISPFVSKG